MSYFGDARDLVAHASEKLSELREAYDQSLREQSVKRTLLIEIKNLMENLRSALDFCAHGLFDRYGHSTINTAKVYFPYAKLSQTQAEFQASQRLETCLPGLSLSRPDIVARLESYQHYAHPDNRWLPLFMELNNENKHERLTPQTREETRHLKLESGGTAISMGPGTSIHMGRGTSIRMGNMLIPGGQTISPDRPARYLGRGTQAVTVWVSFRFEANGELVMPFLENAVEKTSQIVAELESL
jgi:hypothetical protein